MLTKDQFFANLPKFKLEAVEVPGLGTVHVRESSAGERDRFEEVSSKNPHSNFRARLVAASACDEQGTLLFSSADIPTLNAIPSSHLEPLIDAALKVNGMRAEDVEAAKKLSTSDPA